MVGDGAHVGWPGRHQILTSRPPLQWATLPAWRVSHANSYYAALMRRALVAAGTAVLCLAGLACSRKPVVLYNSGVHPVGGITTDATNVYWVVFDKDGSHVTTMPKGGGLPRLVASVRQGIGHSATDDEYVYWTAPGGVLFRAPKAGDAAQELASSGGLDQQWSQLTLDAEFVYWVNEGGRRPRADHRGQVLRVAKSGGPVTVIASEQKGVADVVVNAEHVFWAAQDGVWRWSKTTQTTTTSSTRRSFACRRTGSLSTTSTSTGATGARSDGHP